MKRETGGLDENSYYFLAYLEYDNTSLLILRTKDIETSGMDPKIFNIFGVYIPMGGLKAIPVIDDNSSSIQDGPVEGPGIYILKDFVKGQVPLVVADEFVHKITYNKDKFNNDNTLLQIRGNTVSSYKNVDSYSNHNEFCKRIANTLSSGSAEQIAQPLYGYDWWKLADCILDLFSDKDPGWIEKKLDKPEFRYTYIDLIGLIVHEDNKKELKKKLIPLSDKALNTENKVLYIRLANVGIHATYIDTILELDEKGILNNIIEKSKTDTGKTNINRFLMLAYSVNKIKDFNTNVLSWLMISYINTVPKNGTLLALINSYIEATNDITIAKDHPIYNDFKDFNIPDKENKRPLQYAVVYGNPNDPTSTKVIDKLLSGGAQMEYDGTTIMHDLIDHYINNFSHVQNMWSTGIEGVINSLLQKNIILRTMQRESDGYTPGHILVSKDNYKKRAWILHGKDWNSYSWSLWNDSNIEIKSDKEGLTPLGLLCKNIEEGKDIDLIPLLYNYLISPKILPNIEGMILDDARKLLLNDNGGFKWMLKLSLHNALLLFKNYRGLITITPELLDALLRHNNYEGENIIKIDYLQWEFFRTYYDNNKENIFSKIDTTLIKTNNRIKCCTNPPVDLKRLCGPNNEVCETYIGNLQRFFNPPQNFVGNTVVEQENFINTNLDPQQAIIDSKKSGIPPYNKFCKKQSSRSKNTKLVISFVLVSLVLGTIFLLRKKTKRFRTFREWMYKRISVKK